MSYWIGSDGNVWVSNPDGSATNYGAPLSTPTAYGIDATRASVQTNLINDPNPQTSGGQVLSASTTSGGGGTTSTSTVDPAVIASIQNQINQLDPQQATGLQNILDSYNLSTNRENQAFQGATDQYDTQKTNTIQDLTTAKSNIDKGVNQNTNALQRLLGLAGSGNSSASEILAPWAASRAGNEQRSGVQTTYGRNLQAIDTAYNDPNIGTVAKHNNTLTDLANQEFQNQQGLKSSIANTRASLLNTLATAQSGNSAATGPITDQLNSIINSMAGLSSQYQNPINLATPSSYIAPTLGSYNYGSTGAPTPSAINSSPVSQQTTPYLTSLLPNKKLQGAPA